MKTYMLTFDMNTGWQVLERDEWGNVQSVAISRISLEQAMTDAQERTGAPIMIKLVTRHD